MDAAPSEKTSDGLSTTKANSTHSDSAAQGDDGLDAPNGLSGVPLVATGAQNSQSIAIMALS